MFSKLYEMKNLILKNVFYSPLPLSRSFDLRFFSFLKRAIKKVILTSLADLRLQSYILISRYNADFLTDSV